MSDFYAGAIKAKIIFDDSEFEQTAGKVQDKTGLIGKAGKAAGELFKKGIDLAKQGLEESVRASEEFSKSFANVTTLVDPATVDLGKMRSELLGLDNRLGSAKELTEGLYQAISASVEPADAVRFVGEAAKFAKAGLTSTNKAVDVITTSLNAYGMEADQAGRVSDILFQTIRKGKTTGDQLSRSIGKTIPLAASAGVKFEELGATVAVLTRQGNSTSEATTQLNSTISSLIKPSKAAAQVLEDLGYSSAQTLIEQKGLVGGVKEMIGATDGSNEAVSKLFPNIRALRGVLALTGEGAKDYNEVLQQMYESTGATDEAFQKQELTFETFQNATNKLAITLGDELLPFIYMVTENITKFVEELTKGGQLADILGTAIGYVAGTFEVLKTALEPIVNDLLKTGIEEFDQVAESITDSSDSTKKAQTPFMILAKGLGVLSDVATTLIKGFGFLTRTIINTVNTASSAGKVFAEIGKFLTFQESDITGAWEGLSKDFGKTVDDFGEDFSDLAGSAADTISGLFEDVSGDAEKFQDIFNDAMEESEKRIDAHKEAALNAKTANDELTQSENEVTDSLYQSLSAYKAATNSVIDYYSAKRKLNTITLEEKKEAKEAAESQEVYKGTIDDLMTSVDSLVASSLASLTEGLFEVGIALGSGADAGETFVTTIGNLATAILKALPSLLLQAGLQILPVNLPVGLALIGAAGLAGLGVGAVVGALGIDEKAEGGPAKGLTLVGEEGPELINLKSPSMVVPNDKTSQMMGGGNMYFYFTGPLNTEIDWKKASAQLGRELQAKRITVR